MVICPYVSSSTSTLSVAQRPPQEFNKYHENPDLVIRGGCRRRRAIGAGKSDSTWSEPPSSSTRTGPARVGTTARRRLSGRNLPGSRYPPRATEQGIMPWNASKPWSRTGSSPVHSNENDRRTILSAGWTCHSIVPRHGPSVHSTTAVNSPVVRTPAHDHAASPCARMSAPSKASGNGIRESSTKSACPWDEMSTRRPDAGFSRTRRSSVPMEIGGTAGSATGRPGATSAMHGRKPQHTSAMVAIRRIVRSPFSAVTLVLRR